MLPLWLWCWHALYLNFIPNFCREEDESHQSESESRHSHFNSNDNNANESCSERGTFSFFWAFYFISCPYKFKNLTFADTEEANPELCQLVVDLHSSVQLSRGSCCERGGIMDTSQNTITELSQPVANSMQFNHQVTWKVAIKWHSQVDGFVGSRVTALLS